MKLTDRQWRSLIRDIETQSCILLLGPGLCVSTREGQAAPVNDLFAGHLCAELEEAGVVYDAPSSGNLSYIAQRFMAIPKVRRIDLEDEAIRFFREHLPKTPAHYLRLAKFPFHLAINIGPDDNMARAFREAGKSGVEFRHYNFKKDKGWQTFQPETHSPLVYNLTGSLLDPESLVLSQTNRVEFIKNLVQGNPGLPPQLMSQFDSRKTYIFLGFNFENWSYRLLLDTFHIGSENTAVAPAVPVYPLGPVSRSFFEDKFRFVFVEQNFDDFIGELTRRFEQMESEKQPAPDALLPKRLLLLHHPNPADSACCLQLCNHLAGRLHRGELALWHSGMVLPGSNERGEFDSELNRADSVLVILSSDLLASDEFLSERWPHIRAEVQARNLKIAVALNRHCHFSGTDFEKYPLWPGNGLPIQAWQHPDEAFQNIVAALTTFLKD